MISVSATVPPDRLPPDAVPRDHVAILRAIAAIPRGQVSSYGEIAARAGLPRRARLVGRVLGLYPEKKLPWQRVLRSDGRIAFPPGSRGYREQRARLIEEGVSVNKGRVDLKRYGWQRDVDALIWGLPAVAAAHKSSRNVHRKNK
jgi:methylated-DNA-protein-cysteine methyltransferase-like protein